jgi:3-methylfumaryl-CoA hydratase
MAAELITPQPAEALAGLLDIDVPQSLSEGILPPLWHWVYLLDRRRQSDLGDDGHPTHGVPAPPGPGWLRMFAGGRVTAYRGIRIGEPATRTTEVAGTAEKVGRSGPLTFVTVRTRIDQAGASAVVDEQDIVYRPPGSRLPARTTVDRDGGNDGNDGGGNGGGDCALGFDVDPTVLFRFSALTYNAHRIHYDRAYAVAEGYPDLVVHGPRQALLMSEAIRRRGVDVLGRQFSYRLLAPVFGRQRLTVTAAIDGSAAHAEVRDAGGRITATSVLAG